MEILSSQEAAFVGTSNVCLVQNGMNLVRNSFVLISGEKNATEELWVARVLFLLKISARKGSEPANSALNPAWSI